MSAGQKISTCRKIKSIDHFAFAKDVQHQLAIEDISKINAQECINIYHGILRTTLDSHGPLKSKVTSDRWNTSLPLPHGLSDNELADCFNTFFISTISRIRSVLEDWTT